MSNFDVKVVHYFHINICLVNCVQNVLLTLALPFPNFLFTHVVKHYCIVLRTSTDSNCRRFHYLLKRHLSIVQLILEPTFCFELCTIYVVHLSKMCVKKQRRKRGTLIHLNQGFKEKLLYSI